MESSDRDSDRSHASITFHIPVLDLIFFVHGLSGHPVRSWRHKSGFVWPRDELPGIFQRARIISLGYNSNIIGSGATSQNIFDHARGMLADIRRYRTVRTGVIEKPILFVAHDIGGNILKEALTASFYEDVPEGENIARNTIAIVFFATPQRGAAILNGVYTSLQIVRFLGLKTARKLVKQLRPGSDYLHEAAIRFNEVLKVVPIRLLSLYPTQAAPIWFQRKNSPTREDVSIGNPNEQCLSIEGTLADIQRMSGMEDPNYERVLGWLEPLFDRPFPLGIPTGSAKGAPNTEPSDIELELTRALEHGLLRIVVTECSWGSGREEIDVPVAARIVESSGWNFVSHAFVTENLPNLHENINPITLTFRPASGGASQTRHFRASDIPHPMILGTGGLDSQQGPDQVIEGDIPSGTSSRALPAEEERLQTALQDTDAQQVIHRAVPVTSNRQSIINLSGVSDTVPVPAELTQGDPVSRNIGPGILALGSDAARNVAAVGESSSRLGASTGIALAAAVNGGIGTANAVTGTLVAIGSKTQATRNADIAQENLNLSRRVFKHNRRKEAKDAERTNSASRVNSSASEPDLDLGSDSDSDSKPDLDNVDSGVGRSSSKSPSLRASRVRATTPSAVTRGRPKVFSHGSAAAQVPMGDGDLSTRFIQAKPSTLRPSSPSAPSDRLKPHDSSLTISRAARELATFSPAVSRQNIDIRPNHPEYKHLQSSDLADIQLDDFPGLHDVDALVASAEETQPGVHAYSYDSSTAKYLCSSSAEDVQASKEEIQESVILRDTSMTTEARSDVLHTASKAEAVGEVDNIYDASDHLSIQQDSTNSPDEQEQVQETEPELKTENEALPQQLEDQPSGMLSPAEFRRGSGSLHSVSAVVTVEEQDDPCISFGPESPGGKTTLSTDSEHADTGEVQLLISASDKDTFHESAKKDEQEFEVEESKIEEGQILGGDTVENEVEGNEVEDEQIEDEQIEDEQIEDEQIEDEQIEDEQIEDEQIEDTGVADSNDGEEPAIRGEPEAPSPSLHQLGRARTI